MAWDPFGGLYKFAVQEPTAFVELSKNPQVAAGYGFETVVIALDGRPVPPASFNPFGSPTSEDVILLLMNADAAWYSCGGIPDQFEGVRRSIKQQGTWSRGERRFSPT